MSSGRVLFMLLCCFSTTFASPKTLTRRERRIARSAMVVESSGVSQDLDKDAKLMPGSAKPVESSGSVQYVRKEPKTTVILQASGMIETSSDGELNMGTKDQLVLSESEKELILNKRRAHDQQLSAEVSKNMPERSNAKGPVADALHNAKAELDNQISEEEKAKSDTDLALHRAMQDKEAKESEIADAEVQINYWTNKRAELQVSIQNISATISGLESLSNDQQAEIHRLQLAAGAKHDAAGMAQSFEDEIVNVTDQISQKEQLKVETEARHNTERTNQQQHCNVAYQTSTEVVANLTARINEAQAELDLLTELHTDASCSVKEVNNERICKRCSVGEEPCGDTCVAADETCHHDLGCACKEDGDATLLQLEPSEDNDPHPLRAELENAKAELRRIIAQHQQTINSLQADIKESEDKTAEVESQKQQALADYERSLQALVDQKAELSNASATAQASKVQAEEELVAALSSGEAAIEKLKTELQSSIAELKTERTATEDARARQVTTCEEEKKALLDSQGNVISALVAEIDQLNQQKTDAENQLELIKQQHGVADDTDGETMPSPTTPVPPEAVTIAGGLVATRDDACIGHHTIPNGLIQTWQWQDSDCGTQASISGGGLVANFADQAFFDGACGVKLSHPAPNSMTATVSFSASGDWYYATSSDGNAWTRETGSSTTITIPTGAQYLVISTGDGNGQCHSMTLQQAEQKL